MKQALFILLISFLPLTTWAQIFSPKKMITKPDIDGARAVYTGDIDNDGLLDVVAAGDRELAWFKYLGNDKFDTARVINDEHYNCYSIATGDIDGDGDVDIIANSHYYFVWFSVAEAQSRNISCSYNHNEFAEDKYATVDDSINRFIPPPLPTSTNGLIYLYENLGGGNFAPRVLISEDSLIINVQILLKDLDVDGDLDIISGTHQNSSKPNGKLMWIENSGGLNFDPPRSLTVIDTLQVHYIDIAHIDNDTLEDILFIADIYNHVAWIKNLGGGNFSQLEIINNTPHAGSGIIAADIDKDGDNDVIFDTYDQRLVMFENLGNGTFDSLRTLDFLYYSPYHLSSGDLDNDGDIDIITSANYEFEVAWLENNGDATFEPKEILTDQADVVVFSAPFYLNEDSMLDVLSISTYDNKISWYRNLGNGQFTNPEQISPEISFPYWIYADDLDNDGDVDVISSSRADDKIAWFENLGAGNFSHQKIITEKLNYSTCAITADLDGDGDKDIIGGSLVEQGVVWIENYGNGNFSELRQLTSTGLPAESLFAADLDNDNNIDIISSSDSRHTIAWYRNLGNGLFTTEIIVNTNVRSVPNVIAADIDGDGFKDIIATEKQSYYDGNLLWFKNLSGGGFDTTKLMIADTIGNTNFIAAGDIDNNGTQDIVYSGGANLYGVSWFPNQGGASFFTEQFMPTVPSKYYYGDGAYAVDIDWDNDLDVVVTANYYGYVVYENQGNGSFALYDTSMIQEPSTRSAFPADFDGDGDMDIVSSFRQNEIAWYENLSAIPVNVSNVNSGIVSIYPNPNNGVFTVDLGMVCEKTLITITSINGQIIQSNKYNQSQLVELEIDGASGMYFLSIETERGREVVKVIKE